MAQRKSGIFIGYRREQAASAGRLYDRLSDHFGKASVFMDLDSIISGDDFVRRIRSEVSKCGVMLVLIGPNWLGADSLTRRKRINNPEDWVRLEIETALQKGIWIVPVLVDGAKMPKHGDLPESLRPLTRRHAFELTHTGFQNEIERLIQDVEQGHKVPQEEWRLSLHSNEGSHQIFRLSSDSTEHLITISTRLGKTVMTVDGQRLASGIISAGITGRTIPVDVLSREFGPVATIKVEILNPATSYVNSSLTCYSINLEIDDQVLEYRSPKHDRSLEKRARNELRRRRASVAVERTSGVVVNTLNDQVVREGLIKGLVNSISNVLEDEALKANVKVAFKEALKRLKS